MTGEEKSEIDRDWKRVKNVSKIVDSSGSGIAGGRTSEIFLDRVSSSKFL
jgi:hypothetical protein